MPLGSFAEIIGNGWYCGGQDGYDFVLPDNFDLFVPDVTLVPGNLPTDSYLDLPFPQTPSGGTACHGENACGGDPTKSKNPSGVAFNTRIWRLTRSGYDYPDYQGAWTFNSEISYYSKGKTYFVASDWDDGVSGTNKNGIFLFDGTTGQRLRRIEKSSANNNRNNWKQANFRWCLQTYYTDGGSNPVDPEKTFIYVNSSGVNIVELDDTALGYNILKTWSWAGYVNYDSAGMEGDISYDGQYMVIGATRSSDSKYVIFAVNLIDGTKYSDSNTTVSMADNLDYARVSPSGNTIIVSWHTSYTGRDDTGIEKGMEIYDINMNRIRIAVPGINHWDMYMDSDGVDWIVTNRIYTHNTVLFGYTNLKPLDFFKAKVDTNTTETWNDSALANERLIPLLKYNGIGTYPGKVFSCNSCLTDPDWFYISTWKFDSRGWNSGRYSKNWWWPLYGEIIKVPTNGSAWTLKTARRLCHTRPRDTKYNGVNYLSEKGAQVDFNVSRDGTNIIFCSTMGQLARDLFMISVDKDESYQNWTPANPPAEYGGMDDPPPPEDYGYEPPPPPPPPDDNADEVGGQDGGGTISSSTKKGIHLWVSVDIPLDSTSKVEFQMNGKNLVAKTVDGRGNFVVTLIKGSGEAKLIVDDADDAELTDIGMQSDDIIPPAGTD